MSSAPALTSLSRHLAAQHGNSTMLTVWVPSRHSARPQERSATILRTTHLATSRPPRAHSHSHSGIQEESGTRKQAYITTGRAILIRAPDDSSAKIQFVFRAGPTSIAIRTIVL